jgi:hypothetical protein
MRLAVAFTLLAASVAAAKCRTDGLLVFPAPGSVIPANSHFIIEGVGTMRTRVEALAGTNDLVLKSTDGTDVLTAKAGKTLGVDFFKSGMNRVAVMLTPSKALLPNRQYVLMIDRVLPGYQVLNEGAPDKLSWRTGGGKTKDTDEPGVDKTPPKFQVKPAVAEGKHAKDGDGVMRYLKLRATLTEDAPAYFLVTMKRARGAAAEQKYPVPITAGEATLGHDACSGSFTFDDGRAYKLTIETYDSAGNKAAEVLKNIEAHAPRPGL